MHQVLVSFIAKFKRTRHILLSFQAKLQPIEVQFHFCFVTDAHNLFNYKCRHTADFTVNHVTAVLMPCCSQRSVYSCKQRSTISSGSFGKGIIASGFAGCGAIHFSIQIMSYQRSNLYAQAWKCPTS